MSAWRREALKRIPQCRQDIEASDTVQELCLELSIVFSAVYNRANIVGSRISHTPEDSELIQSLYDYAEWCLLTSHNADIVSNIVLYFYEHLASNCYVRQEIPLFMSPDVFHSLDHSGVFRYIMKAEELDTFVTDYEFHHGK